MTHETLRLTYFYLCAAFTIAGAIATVAARNPIRSAMGLLLTIGGIAALFLSLHAEFLAATQLIVYAGAVVVLFVFVIMLLGPASQPPHDHESLPSRALGATLAIVVASGGIASILYGHPRTKFPDAVPGEGTIEAMSHAVFVDGIVPFEISSALLIVAVVGAVAVARGRQGEPKPAPRDLPKGRPVGVSEPHPAAPASHAGDRSDSRLAARGAAE